MRFADLHAILARRLRFLPLSVGALALAASSSAWGGGTHTFRVANFDQFDSGEVEGAAIEGVGKITVGYHSQRNELSERSAYTCLAAGRTLYVGTADDATVQKLTFSRQGDKDPKIERFAELPGVVVSTLTQLPNGQLLAATLPGGKIVRIDKKGKVSDFATLDVEQIWALVVHKKRLWVGTGPKGQLYSLALDGSDPKVELDLPEKDILSILVVDDKLLVGTSPKARLYQVGEDPEGIFLHEFKGSELKALAINGMSLFAAVNEFKDRGVNSLQSLTKQLNRSGLTGKAPTQAKATSTKTTAANARVYRIDLGQTVDVNRAGEAAWERWLSKSEQYFTDLLPTSDPDSVLVSSSRGGKIYRLQGPRLRATVADLEERQATQLCRIDGDRVIATTGDTAAVYRLETRSKAEKASKAKYTSKVFDAKHPADYGAVVVRGSGDFRLRARSGPSEETDARWSQWREVPLTKRGEASRGKLSADRRRYLQIEITLNDEDAEVRDFSLFYAPENLPPLLTSVAVAQPDFELDDEEEPDHEASIKWKVDARDDDKLQYEVRIRPEGGSDEQWISLSGDEPVAKKELDFDLTTVPDGVYEVAITASDEPSNGSTRARSDELVSAPFTIDRTRPSIDALRVEGDQVRGTISDQGSFVHDVSVSIDDSPFRVASPTDGIFDGEREAFEFRIPGTLRPGRHRLVVRARDARGNIVTRATNFVR